VERGELIAGRYELVERLGRGGMGEVWTCRDRELRRDVAVEMLTLDDAVPPDVPQRFDREAVAAAQINHPNVVALHDRGVDQDRHYLVMERVEGTTLAAHRANVIHYDIKPLNVMLMSDGVVKVVDFDIAGFVQTTFTVARSADLPTAGKPEYGAPEQFGTERGDERSDLYALGGVLSPLLTGQPPFTGNNGLAVVRRKLAEDAPSVASLRPDLPPAVTHLVDDLLQRDPDQRLPTSPVPRRPPACPDAVPSPGSTSRRSRWKRSGRRCCIATPASTSASAPTRRTPVASPPPDGTIPSPPLSARTAASRCAYSAR
jgi:serine/threonine protein kinase